MTVVERELQKLEYIRVFQDTINEVIPQDVCTEIREVTDSSVDINLGVLIGITGNIRAKMILCGEDSVFKNLSEIMFGMSLEGEMLESFTGELGNMMAGNFSIRLSEMNVPIDITAPSIFNGNSKISGFRSAAVVRAELQDGSPFSLYFLLDK